MKPAPILLNDFQRIPDRVRDELAEASRRVIASGWYVLGRELKNFEQAWAAYCGVSTAVGVANGMDAIEIGLRASGIGPGDEVITTPLTAFATVLGILRAGAVPVLADIDPRSGLLDPASAARCVSARTKAVLVVHLYGQLRGMDTWREFCTRHGVQLLEDAAQAHGAAVDGRKAGTFGAWAAYSFYPTKNLGAFGDGGALCTNDAAIAARAVRLRNYGQAERYHHPDLGLNSRLDELQAAFLSVLLRELPDATARRQAIAARYRAEINTPRVRLLAPAESPSSHAYHLFVIRCDRRTELQAALEARGIQTLIHYPVCVHQQPPCRTIARDPHGLREAEAFADDCLSIPCHPYLTDAEVARVVAALNAC
jgi:dTDP-4-amino-4,6-dideoxygalactose transaminase